MPIIVTESISCEKSKTHKTGDSSVSVDNTGTCLYSCRGGLGALQGGAVILFLSNTRVPANRRRSASEPHFWLSTLAAVAAFLPGAVLSHPADSQPADSS